MKCFLLVLASLALAQASFDNIKPVHLTASNVAAARLRNLYKFNPRITGGEEAPPNSLPYQAGLFIPTAEGTAFCGGSLISTSYVVTAAHCGELSQNITVILGAHKIQEREPTQVVIESAEVIVHPQWNRLLLQNDIALIRLATPVELNEDIQVISLPSNADASNTYEGASALASGWGLDSDTATAISPVLREVEVDVIGNGICNIYYLGVIVDSHLCTDGADSKSTCSGDSGGPLVTEEQLVGITSFGISFGCEIGWPAVFTRVTSFLDWIADNSDVVLN